MILIQPKISIKLLQILTYLLEISKNSSIYTSKKKQASASLFFGSFPWTVTSGFPEGSEPTASCFL